MDSTIGHRAERCWCTKCDNAAFYIRELDAAELVAFSSQGQTHFCPSGLRLHAILGLDAGGRSDRTAHVSEWSNGGLCAAVASSPRLDRRNRVECHGERSDPSGGPCCPGRCREDR